VREAIERQYDEKLWLSHKWEAGQALAQMINQYGRGLIDSGFILRNSIVSWSIYQHDRTSDEDYERLVEICESGWVGLQQIAAIPVSKHIPNSDLHGDFGDWFSSLRVIALLSEQCLDGPWNDWGINLAHYFMSAGEWAVRELVRYGFATPKHGGGDWTEVGRALLENAET
jgi:hypothetical protein